MKSESIESIEFKLAEDKSAAEVLVRLASDIPACCGIADGAYIEFLQGGHWERMELELHEAKSGNILEGTVPISASGVYPYRFVARVLGKPTIREGTAHLY